MKRIRAFAVLPVAMLFMLCACGKTEMEQDTGSQTGSTIRGGRKHGKYKGYRNSSVVLQSVVKA